MTVIASTGLKTSLLGNGGFSEVMSGTVFKLYSGIVPAHANDSVGGATLLCTISNTAIPDDGVSFNDSTPAILTKPSAEEWSGTNVASGAATFYRLTSSEDTGSASTTIPRLQGTVGVFNADLNLSSVNLVSGAPQSLTSYVVSLL